MKRIEQPLSKPQKQLKTLYQERSETDQGPFYDPMDIHVHQYITNYINTTQDHKDIYLRPSSDLKVKTYCKLCHEMKPDFELSTTKNITAPYINKFTRSVEMVCQKSGNGLENVGIIDRLILEKDQNPDPEVSKKDPTLFKSKLYKTENKISKNYVTVS